MSAPRTNRGWFKKGGDPRRGRGGGKKGRSGRKPDAWRETMARLVNRESTLRALKRVIKNPRHPAWLGALRFAAEQAYGKPTQPLAVEARLTIEDLLEQSWQAENDRVADAEEAEVLSITPVERLRLPAPSRSVTRDGVEE